MELYCPSCGYRSRRYTYRCPQCGSPLEARDPPSPAKVLGEGDTPLVEDRYRGHRVYMKLEYLNPTGSFKDRGVAASLSWASRQGYRCVVEDSSGNTGISTAAYSSHLGMEPVIIVPRTASPGKKRLIKSLGARLVEEDTREDAARRAEELARECFYVAHAWSPLFILGTEILAWEIPRRLLGLPIFAPVSSGTLLLGLYRGARRAGVEARLYAVQSPMANSLARLVEPVAVLGSSQGMLDALVYRNPPRLSEMAEAVSQGGVYIVGWEYASKAYNWLLHRGYIVEPSSAVVMAAYMHAVERGLVGDAILILTGSGLKYMGQVGTGNL
ncbi:MAG: pyridoxal-phosphate dependent enzyme [Desulfurococcales archaeon]|nr:pyridoxal-phosphate dependent enzyme [Desulfurococcales archaeon]